MVETTTPPPPPEEYARSFQRLLPRLAARSRYFDGCRIAADRDLGELLSRLTQEEFRALVRGEQRFRNPYLIHRLLERSSAEFTLRPEHARMLAETAFRLAGELDLSEVGEDVIRDLALRSLAHQANAERALGRLREADRLFSKVLDSLVHSADPMVRAEILSLASSLDKDRRRFEAARALLDEALELYQAIGDRPLIGRTLLKEASLLYHAGEPEAAITTLEESLPLLAEGGDPQLLLYARHNLADYLCAAGCHHRAGEILRESHALFQAVSSPLIRLRQRWLEGKIALGTGDPERAEAAFREVQAGFLAQDIAYDAAMVSLDLVGLYLEQERHGEIRVLAGEILSIFRSLDVAREALTALLAFEKAARQEAVSRQLVAEVLARLKKIRRPIPRRREVTDQG